MHNHYLYLLNYRRFHTSIVSIKICHEISLNCIVQIIDYKVLYKYIIDKKFPKNMILPKNELRSSCVLCCLYIKKKKKKKITSPFFIKRKLFRGRRKKFNF